MNINKRGFTLIELLVVVLIIGILVAIALPQYKLAVEKAKVSKYLSIAQSIRNAQERFYMVNGKYSGSLSALDIDIEYLCQSRDYNMYFNCMDKSIAIDNLLGGGRAKGLLSIKYCSSLANTTQSSWNECGDHADLHFYMYYANSEYITDRNKTTCTGRTDKGKKLCKALGY